MPPFQQKAPVLVEQPLQRRVSALCAPPLRHLAASHEPYSFFHPLIPQVTLPLCIYRVRLIQQALY